MSWRSSSHIASSPKSSWKETSAIPSTCIESSTPCWTWSSTAATLANLGPDGLADQEHVAAGWVVHPVRGEADPVRPLPARRVVDPGQGPRCLDPSHVQVAVPSGAAPLLAADDAVLHLALLGVRRIRELLRRPEDDVEDTDRAAVGPLPGETDPFPALHGRETQRAGDRYERVLFVVSHGSRTRLHPRRAQDDCGQRDEQDGGDDDRPGQT